MHDAAAEHRFERGAAWALRRLFVAACATLVCAASAWATAQTLTVGADAAQSPAAWARVEEVRRGNRTLGLGVRFGPRPIVDASWRVARAFGPLGTLVLDGEAAFAAGARLDGRARAGARGTLGPVALRAEGRAWSAPPERFDPLVDAGLETSAAGWAATVGVDGRLDRTWLLGGEVRLARDDGPGALHADVRATVRARRAVAGSHDLRLAAGGRIANAGRGSASLGVEVLWQRRRAPEWRTGVGVGRGPHGWGPGVTFEGRATLPQGPTLDWALRLEPYSVARLPYRAELGAAFGLTRGELRTRVVAGVNGDGRAEGAVRAAWRQPWPGPRLR